MKKILLFSLVLLTKNVLAQPSYWQQKIYYNIQASLDDKANSITGKETVVYKNNSPEPLDFIWFHIWPNAYSNQQTALFRQISGDESRKKKLKGKTAGSISGLAFESAGKLLATEAHSNPDYVDIIKVKLTAPLKPGDSIEISTPFTVKLPEYFSRSGYADGQFMACQWYPKPAVYDKDGWHEMPYLDMGEFYSEYGDYTVAIDLPTQYVVAATGELQDLDELKAYKTTGSINSKERKNKPALYNPINAAGRKTLHYKAANVPDFAWFADKDLVIQYDTIQLPSGRQVDAFSFYHNNKNSLWKNSIDYIKNAVHFYSNAVGEYDYPVVQAIEGPKNNSSGGMEYPMVTLITSPDAKAETLDAVITHEVGHNWFMSMLGSNERMHTWQDEGMNSYYQFRYEAEKYRLNSIFGDAIPAELKKLPTKEFQSAVYNALLNIPMEPAIETPAASFATSNDYGIVSYVKAAAWMYLLEAAIGQEKVDKAFQYYFSLWKHRHPQPEDMRA
ncbi:MAG: M1 family peptidase, partial [Chitinophagaceae bacterium]